MAAPIKLVVGLGNPGDRYVHTRHNVGEHFVRGLASQHALTWQHEAKFKASTTVLSSSGQNIRLVMPTTYMNDSGQAVKSIADYYQIAPEEIVVIHDELSFPAGISKIKFSGGHAGHNGLRDIMRLLSSDAFWRIRIGIGHPGHRDLVHHYVLQRPSRADQEKIEHSMTVIEIALSALLTGDDQLAMRQLHQEE